ncbi:MAG TPA: LCP family protein [Candidatus Pristimantibacillus sp.]|nr:LCP family protein [Candidatus Pristimantibacillus sp.]
MPTRKPATTRRPGLPVQTNTGRRPPFRSESELPPPKRRHTLRWIILGMLTLVVLIGGWVVGSFIRNEVHIFGWRGVIDMFRPQKLNGEDEGRVNILLAGNSRDDPGHQGANLTDSIMVLSINTRKHTGFLLSVPRDLYVQIPGGDYGKINEVYGHGGMHSLEQVVSQSLGLPIHYYALVDYTAIQQAVDAVGGIDITIKSSDPRGLYDPSPDYHNNKKPLVDLPNGTQHINGIQALGLARARGDHYGSYGYASGDFTRTSNQRQIIVSLKDKGMSLGTLANPIKLGELFNSVGANVQTDLTSGNVRRLYDLTKDVPDSQIASAGLTDDNVLGSRTIYGAYVLVPKAGLDDYTDVQAFVDKLEQQ